MIMMSHVLAGSEWHQKGSADWCRDKTHIARCDHIESWKNRGSYVELTQTEHMPG